MDNHVNLTASEASRLNQPQIKESSYDSRMRQKQLQNQAQERVTAINRLRMEIPEEGFHYVALMDFIERLLATCGGEPKANFIDISRDFMKILTRVPLKANLHPFLPEEDKNNPRFHKIVTQILIGMDQILGVRWVPVENGTILVLSVAREKE